MVRWYILDLSWTQITFLFILGHFYAMDTSLKRYSVQEFWIILKYLITGPHSYETFLVQLLSGSSQMQTFHIFVFRKQT